MIFKILVVIIPLYILVSGLFMKFRPLSAVTAVIGYSGRVVAKTPEMKQEAYKICSVKWIIAGILLAGLSEVAVWYLNSGLVFGICIFTQLAFMTMSIVIVELGFIKKYGRNIYGR